MLEEVLKHPTIETVTMVDIDRTVIDISREFLPSICGNAFDDPRTDLVIDDGLKFVAREGAKFDIIIIDSTDPIGPGEALFRADFYADCRRRLSDGGVLVTQNGVPFLQPDELAGTMRAFRTLWRDATCYLATVPTYFGGPMAFGPIN